MDLSLLSDAEIRDVDARIGALWYAGLRVLLDDPPAHGVVSRAARMCIDAETRPVEYQLNRRNVWYTCIDADQRTVSTPRTANEAFDLWCAIVGGNVRELYQQHGSQKARPCVVCNVVLKNDMDNVGAWLHHDALTTPSVARLERILAK